MTELWQRQIHSCLPDSAQFDCKSHGWPCTTCPHMAEATDTQTRLNPVYTLSTLMLLTSTNPSSRTAVNALKCFSELHSCIPPFLHQTPSQGFSYPVSGALAFKERLDFLLNLETPPFSIWNQSGGKRGTLGAVTSKHSLVLCPAKLFMVGL